MAKLIKTEKDKLVFVTKTNESLANAIRRSVYDIPSPAIDSIEIIKNDSALFDEIIANRIGLIPLKIERNLKEAEKCACKGKGCNKCEIKLSIKEEGPKMVYADSLKGNATPVFKKIPIVSLSKDQQFEILAFVNLGKGKKHVKFLPGHIYYRNVPMFEFSPKYDSWEKCAEACPKKIIQVEKGKKPVIKEIYECDSCGLCVEACKEHGEEKIKLKKSDEIIFFVESFGQLSPKEIVKNSISALSKNLSSLKTIK